MAGVPSGWLADRGLGSRTLQATLAVHDELMMHCMYHYPVTVSSVAVLTRRPDSPRCRVQSATHSSPVKCVRLPRLTHMLHCAPA
jgi:hypothetical protein